MAVVAKILCDACMVSLRRKNKKMVMVLTFDIRSGQIRSNCRAMLLTTFLLYFSILLTLFKKHMISPIPNILWIFREGEHRNFEVRKSNFVQNSMLHL